MQSIKHSNAIRRALIRITPNHHPPSSSWSIFFIAIGQFIGRRHGFRTHICNLMCSALNYDRDSVCALWKINNFTMKSFPQFKISSAYWWPHEDQYRTDLGVDLETGPIRFSSTLRLLNFEHFLRIIQWRLWIPSP